MNIYDEVKVITHEEARKIVKSNHNKFYTEGTFTNDIQNYIAQCEAKEQRAKKVEELLGLYRKAHIDVLNGELAYQIEALEEELK